jgi:spore germination protein
MRLGLVVVGASLALLLTTPGDAPPPREQVTGEAQVGEGTVHRTMGTWIPYWGTKTAYDTVVRNADLFEYASPFWYRASGVTSIDAHVGAGNSALVKGLQANGIKVLPSVTLGLRGPRWAALMASQAHRNAHVDALVELAVRHHYDGIDLDYESFTEVATAAQARTVRDTFTAVAAGLCARLHAIGKRCTITVMARTGDAPARWRGRYAVWVFDYPALLNVADRLRVMAYHEHGAGDRPGPIASTGWVTRIARYAARSADAVGAPRSRIEIALPAYGFDWTIGGRTTSRTSARMEKLRAAVHATRTWDPDAQEYTFDYQQVGKRHVVYYANAVSTARKLTVIRRYGERYGLWCPYGEDPAVWTEAFRPASTW